MKTPVALLVPVTVTLLALLPEGSAVAAQGGWRSEITNVSITSRSNMTDFLARVEERKGGGYHCIDVELGDSKVWGIFVQCSAITDSEVLAYRSTFYGSVMGSNWHQIDTELTGYSSSGAWFCQVHIQTTDIDGDGYFGRTTKADFKDRIEDSEDSGYTVTDFGYMDGRWRALTSKEDSVFEGRGTFESRASFTDVLNRNSALNAIDKRVLDIEYIGGRWYYYARKAEDLGATSVLSRSTFSDFSDRVSELEADGRFLVDLEIVDGKFYGVTVGND